MSAPSRLERLRQLVAQGSGDPFPLYGLAMEYKRLGRIEEAVRAFGRLLELHPRYIPAYYQFGTALVLSGDFEQARKTLARGIRIAESQGNQHAREELVRALEELEQEETGP
ncbi:MAG: tetratricopeptide repeat protein [Candidatus Aminicenantes bacterium]|nr:tetratricopeptide repeat protein [Candidatus Aminicenantes bacterium]